MTSLKIMSRQHSFEFQPHEDPPQNKLIVDLRSRLRSLGPPPDSIRYGGCLDSAYSVALEIGVNIRASMQMDGTTLIWKLQKKPKSRRLITEAKQMEMFVPEQSDADANLR
jgi:hypothetical protein